MNYDKNAWKGPAERQIEAVKRVKSKDLHTNNGDIRSDAEFRAGWNACLAEVLRQMEGEVNA